MIQTTRWRPDTCDCVITFGWDDSVPEDQRTHILHTLTKCQFHKNLADQDAYDAVKAENVLKNQTETQLLQNDLIAEDVKTPKGTVRQFKLGVEYDWSYDQNRNLIANVVGPTVDALSISDKAVLDTAIIDAKDTATTNADVVLAGGS